MNAQLNPDSSAEASFAERYSTGLRRLGEIDAADVDLATSPKDTVWTSGKVTLYRYRATTGQRVSTPVLIVYSQIGRYTMLDLQPDRSMVRNLLDAGVDVYVIDWGDPNRSDRWVKVDDYVGEYVDGCVDHILSETGARGVTLFGICEGGIFAACHAALFPEKIASLVLAVTPVDFHADMTNPRLDQGQLNRWARGLDADDVAALIDQMGMLPGEMMGGAFQAITPASTLTKFNRDLPNALNVELPQLLNYLRMEQWLLDRPHHPAEAAKQLLLNLYQQNELVRGEFQLDGEIVDLGRLTMPVLNVFATRDHIVPAETASALGRHVGTDDYTELTLNAGHIGVFVSRKANGIFSETLTAWLNEHDLVPEHTS